MQSRVEKRWMRAVCYTSTSPNSVSVLNAIRPNAGEGRAVVLFCRRCRQARDSPLNCLGVRRAIAGSLHQKQQGCLSRDETIIEPAETRLLSLTAC